MATTSNSTDCYNFLNGTSQLIINLSMGGVTCFIAAGSCLIAIVLILVAKGHKVFIYRLLLYMAVDALLGSLIRLAFFFERDYNVQYYKVIISTYCVSNYLIDVYFFLLCWLGLYLFSLAVFRVQLKKTKHEAIGLVTVFVTPLTFLWVFPWRIRKSNFCASSDMIQFISINNIGIPVALLLFLSCLFIGAMLTVLCLNAVKRVENTFQQQHRKAVRETIPLVVFMIAHVVTLSVAGVLSLYFSEKEKVKFFLLQIIHLWPIVLVSLPILLLFQPHIRRKIKCRRSQRLININATSGYGTTVHQSHPSSASYTHFSSPHEDSESSYSKHAP